MIHFYASSEFTNTNRRYLTEWQDTATNFGTARTATQSQVRAERRDI